MKKVMIYFPNGDYKGYEVGAYECIKIEKHDADKYNQPFLETEIQVSFHDGTKLMFRGFPFCYEDEQTD